MVASTAFSLVVANFGMAIAARIPVMTITTSNSTSVNPRNFFPVNPYPFRGSPRLDVRFQAPRRRTTPATSGLSVLGQCIPAVSTTSRVCVPALVERRSGIGQGARSATQRASWYILRPVRLAARRGGACLYRPTAFRDVAQLGSAPEWG